ncbi:hypothetical protein HanPSC8_Chr01g0012441 [Helianthus annuus]|nr:hypothetical protein HanPSC8_Chr01g0012441 [Helianthus annuus]
MFQTHGSGYSCRSCGSNHGCEASLGGCGWWFRRYGPVDYRQRVDGRGEGVG